MHKYLRIVSFTALALMAAPSVSLADSSASSSSASGFSWFANTPSPTTAQTRSQVRAQLVINTSRTWICSPAGFGKRSTCYSG